jgi:IS30 family transposase
MAYQHLNMFERKTISLNLERGLTHRAIADLLCRHHSCISREINRNSLFYYGYSAIKASNLAEYRKVCPRHQRKRSNKKLFSYVIRKLKMGWAPDVISGRLKTEYPNNSFMYVSHEMIYQWIYTDYLNRGTLYKYLPKTHKKRIPQARYGGLRGLIKGRVSIHERPFSVNERANLGDWEGDLVSGKMGTGYFVTHLERKSRYLKAKKIKNKKAESFNLATLELFKNEPKDKLRTLTLDNGKEFTDFKVIEKELGIDIYFADPFSSWQRGSNEHANGILRRFFPKGTDFTKVTHGQLRTAVARINNRPRKILNYQTPSELFYHAGCRT